MTNKKRFINFLTAGAIAFSILTGLPFTSQGVTEASAETKPDEILIASDSVWKYDDTDTDLYTSKFFEENYNDTSWKTGKAPLGNPSTDTNPTFGTLSSGTVINKTNPSIVTYYFRNTFTITDIESFSKLTATIGIDDGCVIYINGVEVNRTYVNEGTVSHATTANLINEPSDATGTVVIDLTSKKNVIHTGTNSIAVSVHNRDNTSSDIYFAMNLIAGFADIKPKQLNSHLGNDASTEINITYTTIDETDTQIVYGIEGQEKSLSAVGTHSQGAASKWFHSIALTGLEPDTWYEYSVGTAGNTKDGKFKTAPAKGSNDSIKFVYLADTQVSNADNAKALGATLAEVSKTEDLDFVYLAGDQTDTNNNESQWEWFFENSGAFPTGGADLYANNTLAIVQGNHDNNTMERHINAPAEEGNIVYSFDYGPATFIMLNLETARYDATAREKQKEYLTAVANDAKARGQWTVVGFHKSLYTGASHIVDSDVIEARKYWAPVFTSLDIDMVLQGHDHVYSRGFVDEDGQNASPAVDTDNKVIDPENAPLYMVGGHAGGLKWYSKKSYTVGTGDPLALGYSFLDVNSTDTGSDVKQEQVIVEMEISNTEYTINTYMFKYNTATDTITTEKYLYDSVTVKRDVTTADISGSEIGVTETGSEVNYTVSLDNTLDANAFSFEVSYDETKLDFVKAESLLPNTVLTDVKAENGKITAILGTSSPVTADTINALLVTFKVKKGLEAGETAVTLTGIETAAPSDDGTSAENNLIMIGNETAATEIYSYKRAADINGDGKITIVDLSIALANYQALNNKNCDIDLDGVVNTPDFIILIGYFA